MGDAPATSRIRIEGNTLVVDGPLALSGTVRLSGDKSISHRAVLLAALAKGQSRISNLSTGADVGSTISFLQSLGVGLDRPSASELVVAGEGIEGVGEPHRVIDCGNSATTLRLGAGILAGLPYLSVLTGDDSLRRRPMERVSVPLQAMGAAVSTAPKGVPPVMIRGGRLRGIEYELPVHSAQVKGAILLAGTMADGLTVVEEKYATREHTETMLQALGAPIQIEHGRISISACELKSFEMEVPGDISSAAFFLVGAAMLPGSKVCADKVVLTSVRRKFIDVLSSVGGDLVSEVRGEVLGQHWGSVHARWSEYLEGFRIEGSEVPALIDEIPILAAAACVARGKSVIRGAQELRTKESDRIAVLARELAKTGAAVEELPDGLCIEGLGGPPASAEYESHGDHRIAMMAALLACAGTGRSTVAGIGVSDISNPDFVSQLASLTGSDVGVVQT